MCANSQAREADVVKATSRIEFLDKQTYRQRRLRDAARLLPIAGAVFMLLPLMWPQSKPDQSLTSSGMLYLFGLWVILIGVTGVLSRVLDPTQKLGRSDRRDREL